MPVRGLQHAVTEAMGRYRILVADDYPSTAEITCTLLAMFGHDCRGAESGARAIALARELLPDIAILDIGLPDVSGYDVARELRAIAQGRRMFLAAVTGWGQAQDRARAFAAGFDHHVLKPADATKLKDIVRRAELSWVDADARGRA